MSDEPLRVLAVRDIAKRLGVPIWRVDYAIEKLDLKPRGTFSRVRVFSEDDLPAIQAQINSVRPPPAVLRKRKG